MEKPDLRWDAVGRIQRIAGRRKANGGSVAHALMLGPLGKAITFCGRDLSYADFTDFKQDSKRVTDITCEQYRKRVRTISTEA